MAVLAQVAAGSRRERSGKARTADRFGRASGPQGRLEDVEKVLTVADARQLTFGGVVRRLAPGAEEMASRVSGIKETNVVVFIVRGTRRGTGRDWVDL